MPARSRSTMSASARGYGSPYRRARAELLRDNPPCAHCGNPATTADHQPPLCMFPHPSLWVGVLVPSCVPCMNRQAAILGQRARARRRHAPRASRAW